MSSTAAANEEKAGVFRRLVQGALRIFKDQKAREFSAHIVFTLATYAAGMAIEKLIITPYLARRLEVATFGALLLGRNATVVLAGGLYSGIYNLLLRHNRDWADEEKPGAVFSAGLLSLFLSLGVISCAIAAIFLRSGAGFISVNWLPILAFSVWGVACVVNNVLQTYWRMKFRITFFNILQLINSAGLIVVLPLHLWFGLSGVYWGWLLAGLIPLLTTVILGEREIGKQVVNLWRPAEAWQTLRRMWVFVWGSVSLSLLQNTDRFIIGWLAGAAAVGAYFKATSAAYMITIPVEPLAGLILSAIAQKRSGDATTMSLALLHGLIFVLMIAMLIGGWALGRTMTDLLYGAGIYDAGRPLYLIILCGCSVSIVSTLLRGAMVVHAPIRWIVWHDTLSVAILVGLSVVLTSLYSLTGAAIAAALSMLLRAVMSEAIIWLSVWRQSKANYE